MAANVTPPLLVIVGETASGKSALALEVAERLNGEIICADSWTVYVGFDIGTAKPSDAEQRRIPHHLLDVADPAKGFSAAVFQRMAKQAIIDISGRGKLPILVGGTGLYIDSVIYNYSFLPPSEPKRRKELDGMTLSELHELARREGLDTSRVDIRNKRRLIRLIENNGKLPTKDTLRDNTLIVGIRRDVEVLRARILQRIDEMVDAGFVDEVRQLGERYGWDCEPMRAPGYRAFRDYVQGVISLDAAKERFMRNDLQLAKKQRTWFKRNNSIHWLDNSDEVTETVELETTFLNK